MTIKQQALRATVEIVLNNQPITTYRGVIYDDNGKPHRTCRYERHDYSAALADAESLLDEINQQIEDQRVTEELKDLARETKKPE